MFVIFALFGDMTMPAKRLVLALGVFLVLAAVAYLGKAMRVPAVPKSGICQNEQIEVHSYPPFEAPYVDTGDRITDFVNDLRWRVRNPGMVRWFAAARRAEKKATSSAVNVQKIYEELGYKFPSGCYAQGNEIAHYPTMLAKIEKHLGLRSTQKHQP